MPKALLLLAVLAVTLFPRPLSAQSPDWNDPRALALIARARDVRQLNTVDSAFQSYHTTGRGFVYFYFDRNDTHEQTLVKTDQAALELWWQAPNTTRQRIVGLRDAKTLPTNIRYHLDHLTVVQDEFPDVIRIGDGDEVGAVPHPAAPGSERTYDFRLIDSLTIGFPSPGTAPVRVYQLEVRPKNLRAPGFVGSLFVDQSTAAIVRMTFTFTAASYVDKSLDRITISIDNSLWEGRYWLPYRQEVEVRREMTILDLVGGSVIRGRFEIGPYDLNVPIEQSTLAMPRVSAAPPAERLEFPFEVPIFSQLEVEGLRPPPSFEEIQEQARQIVEEQYLSGLSKLRFYLPSTSEAIRYDRAEGFYAGGGVALKWIPGTTMRVQAGYATGSGKPSGSVALTGVDVADNGPELEIFGNQLRDMGPIPGSTWLLNSLSSLTTHTDYLDPFYATGLRGSVPLRLGALAITVGATLEEQKSASLEVGNDNGEFRPVRSIDEGDLAAGDLGVTFQPSGGALTLTATGRVAWLDLLSAGPAVGEIIDETSGMELTPAFESGRLYGAIRARAAWEKDAAWRSLGLTADVDAGLLTSNAPAQELFLLGGRETLLGHDYRELVGDRFWLVRGTASRPIRAPFVTGRVFASAGAAELANHAMPLRWSGDGQAPVKGSVGAGVSLLWDVVNLDVGRGLGAGGGWGFAFSASKKFRRWM